MRDSHAYTDSIPHFNSNGNGDANSNGHRDSDANGDTHTDSNTNSWRSNTDSDGHAYRQLRPGNLHDGYYHWHHNRRWHRYRQPLRRL